MTKWFSTTNFSQRSGRESQIVGSTNAVNTFERLAVINEFKRQIGQLADKKTISEAIVAIPFCNNRITQNSGFAKTISDNILDKKFFTLSGHSKSRSRSLFNNPGNSISVNKLKQAMNKYIFPPELDFNKYPDLEPFVMYVHEFSHDLSRDELKDIWQGVMPDIAMIPELGQDVFSHPISREEFFGGRQLPTDEASQVRWIVFKVKQKAATNYYATTKDSYDAPTNRDPAFQTLFTNPVGLEYSYNWPYDYFSLVELAQLMLKIIM